MNLCSSKVFLCLLVGYSLFTIVTPFEPGRNLHPALRQHAEFGEGVRDWFRGVKDKVRNFFGKPTTTTTTPPPVLEVESIKQAMNQFFLDLANTRFNAERDWGFRLGSWYFIKKVDSSYNDPTTQNIPSTTIGYNAFTTEREEFITSTSAYPVSYTEDIETHEHDQHTFITSTTIHPDIVSDNIETFGHDNSTYRPLPTLPQMTTEENSKFNNEYSTYSPLSRTPEISTEGNSKFNNEYSTYPPRIPEMTTEENSKSNRESGEEVDVDPTPKTEAGDQQPIQDRDNEIPVRAPQSAEVISPK